ncbi:MAG: aminotransferase class I/II-fold pyridoxal phosphate-dependent enzyme [Crocinitomicaceae bacterium]|nr:aminotransferase class I/II-fold pyridoxal phosphate-dependent enzyme [Crocinitomicaceae bacterium]
MIIDLRSDTVTKPSQEMREAMFNAPVGDDVFEEDPTVNELEKYGAELFGHEAAIYCSSGTQTNQIALNIHSGPGKEVICHEDAHVYKYEGGGLMRNTGSSVRLLRGERGMMTAEEVEEWINPDNVHLPVTAVISIEDTFNRGGGAVYDFEEIKRIRKVAEKHNLPLHNDGARIFNALAENGIDPKTYAAQFDSISVCLSKGLGAPIGSLLLGSKDFIKEARRVRKAFGGGMRQAGIIAAGGLFALKNNVQRTKEDHVRAKKLGAIIQQKDWALDVFPIETNIVVVKVENVEATLDQLKTKGILGIAFGKNLIRFVTHLDFTDEMLDKFEQES